MACLHPIKIKNRRYEKFDAVKLNNYCIQKIGIENCICTLKGEVLISNWYEDAKYRKVYNYIPPDYYLYVPCGKCAECQKTKRLQWSFRLITHCRQYSDNAFVTLTIAPKYYKAIYKEPKKYLQLFIDRLRKRLGFRPEYFIVPEIGVDDRYTHRLHFHGIIFDTPESKIPYSTIIDTWQYGIVHVDATSDKTCHYVAKYILKDYKKELGINFKPFIFCCNGIGKSYLDDKNVIQWHVNGFDFRDYTKIGDVVFPLSPYYRDKIYSDEVKVVKMVNRIWDASLWFSKVFHGRTFDNPHAYYTAVDSYYRYTLRQGLSNPIIPPRDYSRFDVSNFDCVDFMNVEQNQLF